MPADLDLVKRLGAAERGLAIVATTRADGTRAHLAGERRRARPPGDGGGGRRPRRARFARRRLACSGGRGRAAVTFRSGWEWVAVEGPVELIGPDDPSEAVGPAAVPELLRAVFRAAGGTHDDWDEYDRVMAAEGRLAVLVTPARSSPTADAARTTPNSR